MRGLRVMRCFMVLPAVLAFAVASAHAGSARSPGAGYAPIPKRAMDSAQNAGISQVVSTWDASVADYDGDRWPDFLLVRDGSANVKHSLYHNDGGSFAEELTGQFTGADLHDCPWADVNGDGTLDMFCSNGANVGTETKTNELWIQGNGGRFSNQAGKYGLLDDVYGRGRSSAFIDFNHDAYPDLFTGNLYPRSDGQPSINRFYINVGGSHFRPAPELGLDVEASASCAQAADYNNDGWDDLLVCGKEGILLYRNNSGESFTEVAHSVDLYGFWRSAEMADFNRDGKLDIVRIRRLSLQIRVQGPMGKFAPETEWDLKNGVEVATGDVNGDGWLDVYGVQACGSEGTNLPDRMLINQAGGFVKMSVPKTRKGCGDTVDEIDYDRNGADDFIVLNGRLESKGPLQLISFPNP